MITFEHFVPEGGLPIYLQIIRYVKRGVAAGSITDGDELPSRRVLSAQLGVNPNTVQKAYRTLEEEGIIASRSGAKSEATLPPETVEAVRRQLLDTGSDTGVLQTEKLFEAFMRDMYQELPEQYEAEKDLFLNTARKIQEQNL